MYIRRWRGLTIKYMWCVKVKPDPPIFIDAWPELTNINSIHQFKVSMNIIWIIFVGTNEYTRTNEWIDISGSVSFQLKNQFHWFLHQNSQNHFLFHFMYSCYMFVAFWLIVWMCASWLGDLILELQQFMGFQDQVYEDSDLFFCEQRGKCPGTYCIDNSLSIL
jgi:hypothetical protein